MRRVILLIVTIGLLLPINAQALDPVSLTNQGIIGGNVLDISPSSNETDNRSGSVGGALEASQVVEVYTATWCENCVETEHALMDSLNNTDATVLVFHRFIGESEDPFGTQEGDDRWTDRYGEESREAVGLQRAAPTVVFDGSRMKSGSSSHGESLEADYTEMYQDKHEYRSLNSIESDFSWTGNNSTGTLDWKLDGPDYWNNENITLNHYLVVVEESAYFPDGSNGLEYYEDVVRAVILLDASVQDDGRELGGSVELQLPAAWDGDDLSLVLIHDWTYNPSEGCMDLEAANYNPLAEVDDGSCDYLPPSPAETLEKGLPNVGLISVVCTTLLAAIFQSRIEESA
ncbi:MAG: hypothetical protein QGI21_07115 [Candidatus Poseidoniaceae archaeon]|jgi:hypothetical protein|nr:hypothetical protein [Candidatus Poseidoniaceae archaeon]